MSGKHITKTQKRDYMTYRKNGNTQKVAAAKVDISERSGRNIENGNNNELKVRQWLTRKNPFAEVWDTDILPLLSKHPTLDASFILEQLQQSYPDKYPDNQLRTLQRHVKKYKAIHGNDKDVIFRQDHNPAQMGISDFTELSEITITINGAEFKHLLYHFRLVYSGWSYMKVINGGESYAALSEGLQEALWRLGGSPFEHRTDSLSAAFKNLSKTAIDDLTKRYQEFCQHYQMKPSRNNKGLSHENGAIESPHGHVKRRIKQALSIRGSYDFNSIDDYQKWIDSVIKQHNQRNAKEISIERPLLQDLPTHKTTDFDQIIVGVTSSSTILVKRVTYTVPSRLIGEQLRVLIYQHSIECYLGYIKVFESERKIAPRKGNARVIDYKHIISSLHKKPQAFRYSQIRDDILPNDQYRAIWQEVDRSMEAKSACKFMVGILYLAYKYDCELKLAEAVLYAIDNNQPLSLNYFESQYKQKTISIPTLKVIQHNLSEYDELIKEAL